MRRRESMRLREMCKNYNPHPIIGMTGMEVRDFAIRQAAESRKLLMLRDVGGIRRMNESEADLFASAIADSIHFFNVRDLKHNRELAYREECRRHEEPKHENILISIV